jgi:hypothetical protein
MSEYEKRDEMEFDPEKREVLRRLIACAAFAAPVVVSFPISGLTIDMAMAQSHGHTTGHVGTFQGGSRVAPA